MLQVKKIEPHDRREKTTSRGQRQPRAETGQWRGGMPPPFTADTAAAWRGASPRARWFWQTAILRRAKDCQPCQFAGSPSPHAGAPPSRPGLPASRAGVPSRRHLPPASHAGDLILPCRNPGFSPRLDMDHLQINHLSLQSGPSVVAASRQSAATFWKLRNAAFCRKPPRLFCKGLQL